jgi:hypothetical protein
LLETLRQMWEQRKATRAGRRDGKRGYPGKSEAHALPFGLLAIKERGDQALWKLAQAWAVEDQTLKAQFLTCKRTLIDSESRLDTLKDEYGRRQLERAQQGATDAPELETLERLWRSQDLERRVTPEQRAATSSTAQTPPLREPSPGRSDPSSGEELVEGASRERGKRQEHEQMASRHDVASVRRKTGIGPIPYWATLALVVVGEIPLNAFAFRLFGEADLFSYVMTASVALILIACAHGLGIFLSRESATGAERVLTWTLVIVPVLGIGAIAAVRDVYIETQGAGADLGALQGTLTFGLLNVLIYAGAVVLSYLKHDQQTEHNLKRSRRRLEKEKEREARRHRKRENEELKRLRQAEEAEREAERAEHELARQQRKLQREEEEAQLARKEQTRRQQEEEAQREEHEGRRRAEEPLRKRAEQRTRLSREEERALDALAGQISDTARELESSRTARQKRWEAACAGAMHKKNYFARLMLLYCSGNVATRENHVAPPVLLTLPEIEVPPVFDSQLEWEEAQREVTPEPQAVRR